MMEHCKNPIGAELSVFGYADLVFEIEKLIGRFNIEY